MIVTRTTITTTRDKQTTPQDTSEMPTDIECWRCWKLASKTPVFEGVLTRDG